MAVNLYSLTVSVLKCSEMIKIFHWRWNYFLNTLQSGMIQQTTESFRKIHVIRPMRSTRLEQNISFIKNTYQVLPSFKPLVEFCWIFYFNNTVRFFFHNLYRKHIFLVVHSAQQGLNIFKEPKKGSFPTLCQKIDFKSSRTWLRGMAFAAAAPGFRPHALLLPGMAANSSQITEASGRVNSFTSAKNTRQALYWSYF